ncbi:MAG TPA: hypothetical protein VFP39_05710 [Gemmatimonadales bacterium]|nr:hypothetical protein [Gemmatimonadales bacterium]
MRCAIFVCLSAAALTACSDDTRVVFTQVSWMEWPAEVHRAQSFNVRLVGFNAGCGDERFSPGMTIDNSALTFEPFFVFNGPQLNCPLAVGGAPATPPIFAFFDVRSTVAGLAAPSPRSYDLRAAADVAAPATGPSSFPVRTFGSIVVRSDSVDTSRTNAAGRVSASRDSGGCVRIFAGVSQYVVENPPADTATFWSAFVEGYLYKPAAAVCGDSMVFHLVTRN